MVLLSSAVPSSLFISKFHENLTTNKVNCCSTNKQTQEIFAQNVNKTRNCSKFYIYNTAV